MKSRRLWACLAAAVLVWTSPGPLAVEALAQQVVASRVPTAAPQAAFQVPVLSFAPAAGVFSLAPILSTSLSLGLLPGLPQAPQALPAAEGALSGGIGASPTAISPPAAHPPVGGASDRALFSQAESVPGALASDPSGTLALELQTGLYDGARRLEGSAALPEIPAASDSGAGLAVRPSGARPEDAEPPRASPPAAPRRAGVARAAAIGIVFAVVSHVVTSAMIYIPVLLGHELHSDYTPPEMPAVWTLFNALRFMIEVSLLAPLLEEPIFRVFLMGAPRWLLSKISGSSLARFWIPAVLSSAAFVRVHETSDPVLIASRFAGAMLLAYVYHREGFAGSVAVHGFFNGIIFAGVIAFGLLGMKALALVPLAAAVAAWAGLLLWRQRADRGSGRLAPYRLTPGAAMILAAVLALFGLTALPGMGFLAAIAVIGLSIYAVRELVRLRRAPKDGRTAWFVVPRVLPPAWAAA